MLLFNSPISSTKADLLISLLELTASKKVIDVGCGSGEFLLRTMESSGATGLGLDIDNDNIASAENSALNRLYGHQYEFRTANIRTEPLPPASFDVAVCIGASHAFGDGDSAYPNALQGLSKLVRSGGLVLLGEGYWKQSPAADYLAIIGEPTGIYHNHQENIAVAEQHGLIPLYATVSNEDEWDHFEWSHRMEIEREAQLNPSKQQTEEKLQHSRQWRDAYLRWGRTTMGFGCYLFQLPP